jgi:hypothetical protein
MEWELMTEQLTATLDHNVVITAEALIRHYPDKFILLSNYEIFAQGAGFVEHVFDTMEEVLTRLETKHFVAPAVIVPYSGEVRTVTSSMRNMSERNVLMVEERPRANARSSDYDFMA